MNKSIAIMSHRPGSSREDFQRYYESNHAPLAIRYFPFTKYVRNHLQGMPDADFDTLSEFWSDDFPGIGELMAGQVGDILREDERKFMDRSKIRSTPSTEFLIHGPARGVERAPVARLALLLGRAADLDDDALLERVRTYGLALAESADVTRVTLDVPHPYPGTVFPYAAVLWLGLRDGAATPAVGIPPAGLSLAGSTMVRCCETPPEIMAEARRREQGTGH